MPRRKKAWNLDALPSHDIKCTREELLRFCEHQTRMRHLSAFGLQTQNKKEELNEHTTTGNLE